MDFDPSTLSEEALAYINSELDRARTQASKTARKNALKDASDDPDVVAAIRERIEEEARLSVEERLDKQRKELEAQRLTIEQEKQEAAKLHNRFEAKAKLLENGVPKEDIDYYCDLLTTADAEATHAAVDAFVEKFNATIGAVETRIKTEINATTPTPSNGGDVNGADLVARYETAMKSGDTVSVVAITREAAEKGINIPGM